MTDWYTKQVRERAYAIWEMEGRLHGNDLGHWFRAEAELRAAWAKATVTHEKLWAGVGWKVVSADFFLQQMQRALDRLRDARTAHAEVAGVTVDVQWETPFYANLDAFLAMARSVPDIINWCEHNRSADGSKCSHGPTRLQEIRAARVQQTRRLARRRRQYIAAACGHT